MTQEHPINPPPELVREWATTNGTSYEDLSALCQNIATQSAQWGADAELEACCEWVDWKWSGIKSRELRATRRPKPPSLKEQALQALAEADAGLTELEWPQCSDTIRRALEQLPDNN
jgi:hypothetical protein